MQDANNSVKISAKIVKILDFSTPCFLALTSLYNPERVLLLHVPNRNHRSLYGLRSTAKLQWVNAAATSSHTMCSSIKRANNLNQSLDNPPQYKPSIMGVVKTKKKKRKLHLNLHMLFICFRFNSSKI